MIHCLVLDPVPRVGEQITATSLGIPSPMAGLELINPMERVMPIHGDVHPGQREQVSHTPETLKLQVVSPSSEIIGEGAAIFTDMTEMILDVPGSQQHIKGLSSNDNQKEMVKGKEPKASEKEDYPDLSLPIIEIIGKVIIFVVIWTVCPLIIILWF